MVRDGTGGWRLSPSTATMTLRELRRQLRARRRAIPDADRRVDDRAIHASLRRLGVWQRGRRVAAFLGMPGEVDLRPCFGAAWRRGVRIYVPHIVSRRRRPRWSSCRSSPAHAVRSEHVRHRRTAARCTRPHPGPPPRHDPRAARRFRPAGPSPRHGRGLLRPRAASAARSHAAVPPSAPDRHRVLACQQVDRLEPAPWDVALDLVVTERGILRFASLAHSEEHRRMNYWLLKSEPDVFGIDDLAARSAAHDGVGRRAQLPGAEHASGRFPAR